MCAESNCDNTLLTRACKRPQPVVLVMKVRKCQVSPAAPQLDLGGQSKGGRQGSAKPGGASWGASGSMGGKRSAKKPPPKKVAPKLDKTFNCPFCNHEKSVHAKMCASTMLDFFLFFFLAASLRG